jgi:hypothetical protein
MEILFLWVGLLFASIGIVIVKSAMFDFEKADQIDGELIGYVADIDREGSRMFYPVLGFVSPAGGPRFFQSEIGTGYFPYSIGQPLKVLVSRDDPERARLNSNSLLYFGLIFTAIGLGCCVLFFSIFSWSLFSIGSAIVISLLLVWKAFQQRDVVRKFAESASLIRGALAGKVVDESQFDRSRLISPSELSGYRRRVATQSLVAAVVMIAIGVGGIAGSYLWAPRRILFIERAVGTQGQVVELVESNDSESATFAPMVEFKPVSSSTTIRFRHPVASSPPSWRVGDAVNVLYNPEDTTQAMIDQGRWNLAVPFLPGAIGVVFGFLGLLGLIRVRV